MAADLLITSPANPRLKSLVALRRRRVREQEGRTLVEGCDELALALAAGVVPHELYYCPELMGGQALEDGVARGQTHGRDVARGQTQGDVGRGQGTGGGLDLVDRCRVLGTEVMRLSRAAFEKAAYRQGPDGFLSVVDTPQGRCADLRLPAAPLLLVCEQVEKPGNLGAMLRTADAAGVDAVIAADAVTDWGNPNTVRASKGTVFSVPVASDTTEATVAWLASNGIPLVAATPETGVSYTDIDYRGPVAIAVGAEQTGLTAELIEAATHRVQIPMVGRANSLNVATSAAIITYEAVRQRG